jgi:hypothetical protein
MRTALAFLLIPILLLVYLVSSNCLAFTPNTVDLHVGDTYFVFEQWTFALWIALLLATFFVAGGVLGTGFRSRFFLLALLVILLTWAGLVAFVLLK